MGVYVGLDIGGTKILAAAADGTGRLLRRARVETPFELEAGLATLAQLVARMAGDEPVLGLGVAIGGPLAWPAGIVSPLHQPAWRQVPLRARLEARWRCPCYVDVDTNVAVLGEYAARPERPGRLLYLTLSTGMGGGFLIDGAVFRGEGGVHPEFAHQSVAFRCARPAAIQCECGVPDCLEALVSGNGIRRVYGRPAEELGAAQWAEVAFNLGQGLRNLAIILAPQLIVLGGGVAIGGGPDFVAEAAAVMRQNLRLVPPPAVEISRLGHDTALAGALFLARHGFAAPAGS